MMEATDPGELQRKRAEREAAERAASTGVPPLPGDPADGDEPEAEADVQLSIEGDADVKLTTVGGKAADQSALTIVGGEIRVAGAMKKGDRVRVVLEGYVTEVAFSDLRDSKTGQIVGVKRKHKMTPDLIQRQALRSGDVEAA